MPSILHHPNDVVFLDYEASSLRGVGEAFPNESNSSYPIEVGLAYSNGQTEAFYIKPSPDWTDWDDTVEQNIHKITRQTLETEGLSTDKIAFILNQRLSDKTVFCDGKFSDTFWTNRLFSSTNLKCTFHISYLYDVLDKNDPLFDTAYEQAGLSLIDPPHRAGEDAAILMRFYQTFYDLKHPQSKTTIGLKL